MKYYACSQNNSKSNFSIGEHVAVCEQAFNKLCSYCLSSVGITSSITGGGGVIYASVFCPIISFEISCL